MCLGRVPVRDQSHRPDEARRRVPNPSEARLWAQGWILSRVIAYIPDDIPVLYDCSAADIGLRLPPTQSPRTITGRDAVTVNPYMESDWCPLHKRSGQGRGALQGEVTQARELQELHLKEGNLKRRPCLNRLVFGFKVLNGNKNVGLVGRNRR